MIKRATVNTLMGYICVMVMIRINGGELKMERTFLVVHEGRIGQDV